MTQIDAKTLDHGPEMKEYYEEVKRLLVEQHHRDRREADALVDQFFSLDVDPLERCLVMHEDPEDVARDLATYHLPEKRED